MPNPVVVDLHDLESLLLAAKKYEMRFVTDAHKKSFEGRAFIRRDPLHPYAIACECGLDDRAKYVARNADTPTVIRRSSGGNLKGATVVSFHCLITFLVERDNELHPILERGWATYNSSCGCSSTLFDYPPSMITHS